jgi:excisionase family DNA binding protein
MNSSSAAPVEPYAHSVEEVSKLTSIGKTKIWEEINAGRLRSVRHCGRVVVRPADIRRWLEKGLVPVPVGTPA